MRNTINEYKASDSVLYTFFDGKNYITKKGKIYKKTKYSLFIQLEDFTDAAASLNYIDIMIKKYENL